MGETILHGEIPSAAELCCVMAEINLTEIQDSSAKSHFHCKTLKCRLILETMGDSVIACPVYETLGSIHVITSVEFFKSQLLQKNLKEINITWTSPRPVTPDVYANCLRYSIYYAIAPRWNSVGQYLIAEKYFLTNTESNVAMRLKLSLQTTKEMKMNVIIKMEPLKIKLCHFSLEDVDIPHEVIAHFMADPVGKIDVTHFGNNRVTVLPSLKRGRLMAVLKTIPASSPFDNYGELIRHWKNMYGYRLPKSEIGIIYYDVYFAMPSAHRYLYPHVCVRSRLIETPYLANGESLVRSFLKDTRETLSTICGHSFKIVNKSTNIGNSTISSDSCQGNKKTVDGRVANTRITHGNLDETTRLSFTSGYTLKNHWLCGDLAGSPVSPSSGILMSSVDIGRDRDTKSASAVLRLPRTTRNDDGPENQNSCSNVQQPRAHEHKSLLQIFTPIASFDASCPTTNEISPIFEPLKFQKESQSASEIYRNKSSTANYDVTSRYFETIQAAGSNNGLNQSIIDDGGVSESRGKAKLSFQKLRNNVKSKNETKNSN